MQGHRYGWVYMDRAVQLESTSEEETRVSGLGLNPEP